MSEPGEPPPDGGPSAVPDDHLVLTLYLSGASPMSRRALTNLAEVCDEHLRGRFTLEVVDVFQRPELATDAQIYATPTLVRLLPRPVVTLIGDLSDRAEVLSGLGIDDGTDTTPPVA